MALVWCWEDTEERRVAEIWVACEFELLRYAKGGAAPLKPSVKGEEGWNFSSEDNAPRELLSSSSSRIECEWAEECWVRMGPRESGWEACWGLIGGVWWWLWEVSSSPNPGAKLLLRP
jgi:hypothetical protein